METTSKPVPYFPKRHRGAVGKQAEQAPARSVSSADNIPPGASDAPLQPETQTQIANRIFRQRAEKIAGVEMKVYEGENEWEPLFLIVVPELRSEAARRIYKLRGDLYRKYAEANLNVEVRGRRERGEGMEDAPFLIS